MDTFSNKNPYIKLEENKTTIRASGDRQNAYGVLSIKSTSKARHTWKFRILEKSAVYGITIGIVEDGHLNLERSFAYKGFAYALQSDGDMFSANCNKEGHIMGNAKQQYKKRDIIAMTLDLKTKTLSFTINNNNNKQIKINNIKINGKIDYKMAVFLSSSSSSNYDSVKLIKYVKEEEQIEIDEKEEKERENKMIQLENENKSYKNLLSTKSEQLRKSENKIKTLEKQLKHLKEIQTNNQTLENKVNQIKKEVNQYKKQNEALKREKEPLVIQQKELKTRIKTLQSQLDETTQANLRQQSTILKLENVLNSKTEEEQKNEDDNNKCLNKILKELNGEIKIFKESYNEKKIQEIYNKSPTELIQNDSKTNVNINKYNTNIENIILSSKSFVKYINDIQSYITKISIQNVNEYESWNLEQMMAWILTLDGGKYGKYIETLREGFVKSDISTGDVLPELSRSDLGSPPFSINEFAIKRDLVKHFKSLTTGNSNQNEIANIAFAADENEGTGTAYIGR